MTKITKSLALLCAVAPLISSAADSNAPAIKAVVPAESLFTNNLIAKGKDVSVTRNQLDDEIVRTKAVMAAQNRTISPEEMPILEEQVMDKLVSQQLILNKATAADRAK